LFLYQKAIVSNLCTPVMVHSALTLNQLQKNYDLN